MSFDNTSIVIQPFPFVDGYLRENWREFFNINYINIIFLLLHDVQQVASVETHGEGREQRLKLVAAQEEPLLITGGIAESEGQFSSHQARQRNCVNVN